MFKLCLGVKLVLSIFISAFLYSCESDSEPQQDEKIEVYGVTLNGSSLNNGMSNIPLNGTIEINFSHLLNTSAFKEALSFSDSQGEANYQVTLASAGLRAVISYSDLNPNSEYTLSLNPAVIGSKGEVLSTAFSRSFTTTNEAVNSKSPCTTGTEACLEKIQVEGNSFSFYSSFDIISDSDYTWEQIEEVIIVVHGQNRDANQYFNYMTNSIASLNRLNSTLVIAPFFKEQSDADSGDLYWGNDWREGDESENTGSQVSSFTVIDEIVQYLANTDKFPNLEKLYFSGHSSGAMMIQHYAFANKVENTYSNYQFQYIIANNQYFYYPDERRYNESTGEFYIPTDCTGYDYWPYGYEFAPSYLDGINAEVITDQLVTRNTVYLLGKNDTLTEGTLNTTDCAAVLLGSNRLERGRNIYNYFETYYPSENNHQKIEVDGIGHDANAMFNSTEFRDLIRGQ